MDWRGGLRLKAIGLTWMLLGAALAAQAQPPAEIRSGEIRGEVKDPLGAAMTAAGTLRNLASGAERNFETDAQGAFDLTNLPYGRYRLEVRKTGFSTQSEVIDVQAPAPISVTLTLPLAAQASSIDVVAATPLPGTDLPLDEIPAPVQTVSARDLTQSGALDLSDLLNQRLSGVHINQNQENPFQPDVNYRGYTASPLLGTPEGISVYMDGVRQNQPFGDIVAWDLIPKVAISEVALMPGSNPLFGLNTLGGALSIETKDGHSAPGTSLSLSGGSFGRRAGEFEHGGSNAKGLSWYVAGNLFREDGWREHSPSEVRQAFGKLGWQHGKTSLDLSFAYADNWLTGNGLQDFRFLAQDYNSVYTIPDITWNRSPSFNLSARHDVSGNLTFSGNAYFRYIRADTTNGDINSQSFRRISVQSGPGGYRGADRRRLLRLPGHRQRDHRAVPLLELHRARPGAERTDQRVHRHDHQYLHEAEQLRAVGAGVLAGFAQPCNGRRGLGPQQHDLPAGKPVRILESRPHHGHSHQRFRGRHDHPGRCSRRHARQFARPDQHVQRVCDRHHQHRQIAGSDDSPAAITARRSTIPTAFRPPRWQARAVPSTANMFSDASIRPPA